MSAHSVFVLNKDGKPLTPTTPARARKLLQGGAASKVWSKFGTFGIQLLASSRSQMPFTTLGVDHGTEFEGFAVVCGKENALAVKLDLPDKKKIARKLAERRVLRRARRFRKCRRRPTRSDNRSRKGFLAPSQGVMVGSRLKVLRELFRIYPILAVGLEDVCFNHAAKRWGANFSTMEIGKARIQGFFAERGAPVLCSQGFQTKKLREKYGYRKTANKAADRFEAHCSDALALAVEVGSGSRVEPGRFLVVDDTYRPVRRRLHDSQPARGGVRAPYSRGTVWGLRKGLKVGAARVGRLSGEYLSGYRYYDEEGKRQSCRRLSWVSTQFVTREERCSAVSSSRQSPHRGF